ncbi:MAG: CTP synthase [Candidatus Cloacimonetes bacterium]|nr:CTP synthase [Candidatus Cloacimonadota bacterium]
MAKYIFVIGGVLSSLGKGIASASIGFLLNRMGYSVGIQKLDPYLNVDPGMMSPFQHGEVYVTDDGGETDLDLGHYERFIGVSTTKDSNATSGVIYDRVIQKERRGEYEGKTVQVIPHITNEIKSMINKIGINAPSSVKENGSESAVDIAIIEIGGTVGDIESLPFLEAIRQFRLDVGIQNSMFLFLTYVPYMKAAGELKTKPTQHSTIKLREIGIQPDIILCRTEKPFTEEITNKIALFTNVPQTHVKPAVDSNCVYEIPKNFYNEGIHELVCNHFGLAIKPVDFSVWDEFVFNKNNPESEATIILCGKYVEHPDAYKSVEEALKHAAAWNKIKINIMNIDSEKKYKTDDYHKMFKKADGVLIPGGFGSRGIDGKMKIIQYVRENQIPLLGICLGMQVSVIEFATNVCGLEDACSTEFKKNCKNPVIDLMDRELEKTTNVSKNSKILSDIKGKTYAGTMRLGAYDCVLKKGSKIQNIYNEDIISERHRHRYELNNNYRDILEKNGLFVSGVSPDGNLVEIIEIPDHPFYVGVQFHPEFKSRPDKPHKLFKAFVKAVKDQNIKRLTKEAHHA